MTFLSTQFQKHNMISTNWRDINYPEKRSPIKCFGRVNIHILYLTFFVLTMSTRPKQFNEFENLKDHQYQLFKLYWKKL